MSRLLSGELFKIRKGLALPITLLVNIAYLVFYTAIVFFFVRFASDLISAEEVEAMDAMTGGINLFPEYGVQALSASLAVFFQVIAICAAVLAGIWICDDFDGGTIRNLLSVGVSRTKYYFTKMLCIFVISIIFAIITTLLFTGVITLFFSFGTTSISAVDLLMFFGGHLLTYLTYVSIFVMLAFLFRNVGATLGVGIAFAALLETILVMVLGMPFASSVSFLSNIFPYHNLMQFSQVFIGAASTTDYLIAAAVCGVTVVITTAIGLYTFNKRDVK